MKSIIYKHYWWILILSIIIVIGLMLYLNIDNKIIISVLGVLLSSYYFLQKQGLEEMSLFVNIFKECNKRYDSLNEDLNLIRNRGDVTELTTEEKQRLMDYFNLCGEEFLYFKHGYILPDVWSVWAKGMCRYLRNNKIKEFWIFESNENYYSGLTVDLFYDD